MPFMMLQKLNLKVKDSSISIQSLSSLPWTIALFGKPTAHPYRRMGVALAKGGDIQEAREKATKAASQVKII